MGRPHSLCKVVPARPRKRAPHAGAPPTVRKTDWDRPGTGAFAGPPVQTFAREKVHVARPQKRDAFCKTVIRRFESGPHLRQTPGFHPGVSHLGAPRLARWACAREAKRSRILPIKQYFSKVRVGARSVHIRRFGARRPMAELSRSIPSRRASASQMTATALASVDWERAAKSMTGSSISELLERGREC